MTSSSLLPKEVRTAINSRAYVVARTVLFDALRVEMERAAMLMMIDDKAPAEEVIGVLGACDPGAFLCIRPRRLVHTSAQALEDAAAAAGIEDRQLEGHHEEP